MLAAGRQIPSVHPTEELLEEYCFRRVSEPALTVLEEHLLICGVCQDVVSRLDEYIALMKAATRNGLGLLPHQQIHRRLRRPKVGWVSCVSNRTARIAGMGLTLTIVVLTGLYLTSWQDRLVTAGGKVPGEPVAVTLASPHSGDEGTASAPAGHALNLRLQDIRTPDAKFPRPVPSGF